MVPGIQELLRPVQRLGVIVQRSLDGALSLSDEEIIIQNHQNSPC